MLLPPPHLPLLLLLPALILRRPEKQLSGSDRQKKGKQREHRMRPCDEKGAEEERPARQKGAGPERQGGGGERGRKRVFKRREMREMDGKGHNRLTMVESSGLLPGNFSKANLGILVTM
jgi:hypothetical protein